VRTCRQLLTVEPALWLFVTVEGIEPTNNAAEQAIRPAVLWRKCSYGSQSVQGSLFVGRIMTVVTSLYHFSFGTLQIKLVISSLLVLWLELSR